MTELCIARVEDDAALHEVLSQWALADTAPVLLLVGGADGMDEAATAHARRVIEGPVLDAVTGARAVLLDGGTDAGVMRIAGHARTTREATFPLVGVVPAELVDLPGPGGAGATDLQPDHTHLVAVPGARWGAETPWLMRVAEVIAGRRPIVTVIINGGAIALQEVAASTTRGHTTIAVGGTGRGADSLTDALEHADRPSTLAPVVRSGLVESIPFHEDARLRARLAAALSGKQGGAPVTESTGGAAVVASSGDRYEDQMRRLIAETGLEPTQQMFLTERWLEQVVYMGGRASIAKRRHQSARVLTVVGGVLVPAFVTVSLALASREDVAEAVDLGVRFATFVVSAMVAIAAALEGFFQFGERWRHYRRNTELLKSEGWQFLTRTGAYRRPDDWDDAFQQFAVRVEGILRDDVEGFMESTKRAVAEKHDVFTRL